MTEIPLKQKMRKTFLSASACAMAMLLLQSCGSSSDDDGVQRTGFSYVPELQTVYQPYKPEIGPAIPLAARAGLESADLPYPPFNAHDIKAIGPDAWRNRDQLINAGVGGVIFNQLWSTWQPSPDLSLSEPNTFSYDGMVWRIDPVREKQIRWYSARGIKVTAVLFATPEWARQSNTAKVGDIPLVDPKFIAPDNPHDFARFAGMIAKRYNGANGNGRIVNFIIQNEVNALDWYNPGCGAAAHPCDINAKINSYANVFNLAYDRILQEQSQAHVFFSFDHHFGYDYYEEPRFTSAQRFIESLDPLVAPREWRMAFHSYPRDLFNPTFSPYDYPKVTFGNLGLLAGFLHQRFPTKPHAWDIHLTENGLNAGAPPSSEALQNAQMDVAVRNVIGTPGINNFVYHRMRDHYQEGNFQPGLHDIEDRPKAAWNNWSTNNLYRRSPPRLAHGYEDLPYVRLVRSVNNDIGHWASTRQAPAGFVAEASFLLLRDQLPNTTLLYECHVNALNVTRITRDVSCGGDQNYGPVGYIYNYNDSSNSRYGLYSIAVGDSDYIISTDPNEVPGVPTHLGFIDASKVLRQPIPQRDLGYFNTAFNIGGTPASSIQASPEQVISKVGDCSDGTNACNFIRFATASGLSNELRCRVQPQATSAPEIILTFGNDSYSRSMEVTHSVNVVGDTYSIPLPIQGSASWASVILSSNNNAPTDHCSIVQNGQLLIGAAEEDENNLLQNGGFEESLTDWEFCAADDSAEFTGDSFEQSQAMKVANGNCVYQEVAVDVGNEYSLSCHARHSGPGIGTLRLSFANSSFQKLSEKELTVSSGSYEEYSIAERAPEGSVYAVVTYQSGVGSGQVDACSLVIAE